MCQIKNNDLLYRCGRDAAVHVGDNLASRRQNEEAALAPQPFKVKQTSLFCCYCLREQSLTRNRLNTKRNELSEEDFQKLTAVMKRPQDVLIYCTALRAMQMSGGCGYNQRQSFIISCTVGGHR